MTIPRHPFQSIPPGRLRRYVVPLSVVCILLFMVIDWCMDSGPHWRPFMEFTASGSPERAAEILAGWSARDRVQVGFVSGIDFLFGPLYANLLGLGMVWASRVFRRGRLSEAGVAFAWIAWLVLLLDIPENAAYFNMARGLVETPWPQLCAVCVRLRTWIVCIALAYLGIAIVRRHRELKRARAVRG